MEDALSSVLGRSTVVYYCWWWTRVSLKGSRLDRPTDFLGSLFSFWGNSLFLGNAATPRSHQLVRIIGHPNKPPCL